jgi:hypothetical protein
LARLVRWEEKMMRINRKLAIALLCALLVCMPWVLEMLGVHLPKGIGVVSTWIGVFGLFFLLVASLKEYLGRG